MYSRKIKVMFGFMAFVMSVGYAVMLLVNVPAFQGLFGSPVAANNQTRQLVEDARERVRENDCAATGDDRPTGDELEACRDALEELGAGYRSLASGNVNETGELPADSERNLEKSLEAFQVLHRLFPEDRDATENLAVAYSYQGNSAAALPLWRELAKEHPEETDYLLNQAQSAQQAGRTDEALEAYRKFVKQNPDDPSVEQVREQIAQLTGEGEAADGGGGGEAIEIE